MRLGAAAVLRIHLQGAEFELCLVQLVRETACQIGAEAQCRHLAGGELDKEMVAMQMKFVGLVDGDVQRHVIISMDDQYASLGYQPPALDSDVEDSRLFAGSRTRRSTTRGGDENPHVGRCAASEGIRASARRYLCVQPRRDGKNDSGEHRDHVAVTPVDD